MDGVQVRLIVPLIDNYYDYFGGLRDFASYYCSSGNDTDSTCGGGVVDEVTFFTEPSVRRGFKDYIHWLVNRNNSITGVAYHDVSQSEYSGSQCCRLSFSLRPAVVSGRTQRSWGGRRPTRSRTRWRNPTRTMRTARGGRPATRWTSGRLTWRPSSSPRTRDTWSSTGGR